MGQQVLDEYFLAEFILVSLYNIILDLETIICDWGPVMTHFLNVFFWIGFELMTKDEYFIFSQYNRIFKEIKIKKNQTNLT